MPNKFFGMITILAGLIASVSGLSFMDKQPFLGWMIVLGGLCWICFGIYGLFKRDNDGYLGL